MRQLTLASASFDKLSKQTRRAKFLAEMDQVVPWRELCALVAPFYPKAGNGRPPIGLERMLRLHFLQIGTTYRILRRRKRFMTPSPCGALSASTSVASRCPTKPPS